MPYSKRSDEVFTYFEDWEREAIEGWLTDSGHHWDRPVICGRCCGFWDEEFRASLTAKDVREFKKFATEKGIGAIARRWGIDIDRAAATANEASSA